MCVPSVEALDVTTLSSVINAWTTINIQNMLSQYIDSLIQSGMTRYTVSDVTLHLKAANSKLLECETCRTSEFSCTLCKCCHSEGMHSNHGKFRQKTMKEFLTG